MAVAMNSYRDLDAYRMARTMMAGVCRDAQGFAAPGGQPEAKDELAAAVVSLALHIVDGWKAAADREREKHYRMALAAADRVAVLIDGCQRRGLLADEEVEQLTELRLETREAILRFLSEPGRQDA